MDRQNIYPNNDKKHTSLNIKLISYLQQSLVQFTTKNLKIQLLPEVMMNIGPDNQTKIIFDIDLVHIPVIDIDEPLVNLNLFCPSINIQLDPDSRKFFGKNVCLVRLSVAKMLARVQDKLSDLGLRLFVCDGYRPLELQGRLYNEFFGKLKKKHPNWDMAMIEKEASTFIAPVMAGVVPPHSTGGAVDVTIEKNGTFLEMGSSLRELSNKSFTASNLISSEGQKNRLLLKQLMEEDGFYNYPGEWWHYSYGDRNWAYALNKKISFYNSVPYTAAEKIMTESLS